MPACVGWGRDEAARAAAMPALALRSTEWIFWFMPAATRLSWFMLAASVPLTPSPRLVRRRSCPAEPIDTVFSSSATESAPSATELAAEATAREPIAVACAAVAWAPSPTATERVPCATEPAPAARLPLPVACAAAPVSLALALKYLLLL